MIARFRRNWRLTLCLSCASLALVLLYLSTYTAFGQIPPPSGGGGGGGSLAVQFQQSNFYVAEDDGTATIYVELTLSSTQTVTVDYATSDGTATAPTNYLSASGTLTFNPGVLEMSFPVTINQVGITQNLTVNLTLSNPTNAPLGTPSTAVLTIIPANTTCP